MKFLGKFAQKCNLLIKHMHNQFIGKSLFVLIHLQWAISTRRDPKINFNKTQILLSPKGKKPILHYISENYIKIIIFIVNIMHLSTF